MKYNAWRYSAVTLLILCAGCGATMPGRYGRHERERETIKTLQSPLARPILNAVIDARLKTIMEARGRIRARALGKAAATHGPSTGIITILGSVIWYLIRKKLNGNGGGT